MDTRRFRLRAPCLFLLPVVVMACSDQPRPSPEAAPEGVALPVEVEGWRATGEREVWDTETIFSYIDGHAEVYLAYGMKRCISQRYSGPEGEPEIVVDLFEVGSSSGIGLGQVDAPNPIDFLSQHRLELSAKLLDALRHGASPKTEDLRCAAR